MSHVSKVRHKEPHKVSRHHKDFPSIKKWCVWCLFGMHTFTGCDSISAFQVVGRRLPSSWWSLIRPTRMLSINLDIIGNYLQSCFRDCNRSPAKCTCHPPVLLESSSCGINSFVPSVDRWNPFSFVMSSLQTCSACYQAVIWKLCLQCQPFFISPKNHE